MPEVSDPTHRRRPIFVGAVRLRRLPRREWHTSKPGDRAVRGTIFSYAQEQAGLFHRPTSSTGDAKARGSYNHHAGPTLCQRRGLDWIGVYLEVSRLLRTDATSRRGGRAPLGGAGQIVAPPPSCRRRAGPRRAVRHTAPLPRRGARRPGRPTGAGFRRRRGRWLVGRRWHPSSMRRVQSPFSSSARAGTGGARSCGRRSSATGSQPSTPPDARRRGEHRGRRLADVAELGDQAGRPDQA
jgi:hypothetical protein